MYRPLCRGRYTSPKEIFRMFFGLRFLEVTPHSPMVGSASYASRPYGRAPQATPPGPMVGLRKLRLQALWSGSASYASKIAVTPCPPAAQTEIRPRTGLPVSFFFSASCLANCATIRPPVAANG